VEPPQLNYLNGADSNDVFGEDEVKWFTIRFTLGGASY
jgi:hypothetical protein